MRIIILRHGEAAFNGNDRLLTERGFLEAHETASKLQGIRLDKCLVSPKTRAMQTAQIVTERLGYQGRLEKLDLLTPSVILML